MINSESPYIACLVDTDVIIDFLRGRPYAKTRLEALAEDGLLAISTLTHLEVFHGMRAEEEKVTGGFLDGLTSVKVDISIARTAGKLLNNLRARGITIGVVDAVIAATAQELGVPLVTNNTQHYPFPHLKLIKGTGI
ncbi:MAG: type II toxin-antitoxin system VapC family toxin [Dehalococcoidales bacterium]|nr:type II toxin-antitoxin system VapC family toxin [Dehalococcoidales bacterium]